MKIDKPSKLDDGCKNNKEKLFESSENNDSKYSNTSSEKSNDNPKNLQKINKAEQKAFVKHQSRRVELNCYQEVYNSENHKSFDRIPEDTIPLPTSQTPDQLPAESQLPSNLSFKASSKSVF